MAKRRAIVRYRRSRPKRRNYGKKFTLPLSVVAGFAPGVSYSWSGYKSGGFNGVLNNMAYAFGGFDASTGKWNMQGLYRGLFPAVGGFIIHMIASKLGVNRQLARVVPIIRI